MLRLLLALQGLLVHNMRYLASVVSNCFTAFGELLALNKRFAELSGGIIRCVVLVKRGKCKLFRQTSRSGMPTMHMSRTHAAYA